MSGRILVVDDNPLNQKLLAAKLTHEYYIVTLAADGVEALEKIEKDKPDIILLDVMMPRMDGFEACKRIKGNSATAHIPVVMVTALSDVSDRVKGLECGADDFLTKPINDVALLARVRSLLRLKLIMDEWRIRENLTDQIMSDEARGKTSPADEKNYALLLEDNPGDQKFISDQLNKIGVATTIVGSVEQAVALAEDGNYSMILASLNLNDEDGLQLCPQVRANAGTRLLPILLIGNEGDVPRVAKGLDLGANDYILRPIDENELVARAHTQLKQKNLYDRLRRNLEEGLSLALVDPLTGIFNRRYLNTRLPKAIARKQHSAVPMSVLMIDVDFFKKVNDTYGHGAGDNVLKEIAKALQNNIRPFDLLARMGGEEFIIVMPEADTAAAAMVAERLRKRIEELSILIDPNGMTIKATVSIGCAEITNDKNETAESLIERADKALYEAKQQGRNRVVTAKL